MDFLFGQINIQIYYIYLNGRLNGCRTKLIQSLSCFQAAKTFNIGDELKSRLDVGQGENMRNRICILALLTVAICLGTAVLAYGVQQCVISDKAEAGQLCDAYGEQLGTVRLPFVCNNEALPHAIRGLALLHHMTYVGAQKEFAKVAKLDPDSPVGYWGQAMVIIHPLWSDPPNEEEFNQGKAFVAEARKRVGNSAKAKAFVEAVGAYFDEGMNSNEQTNLEAFRTGWQSVHEQFPNDVEATSFYALAHMATAAPSDKSYEKQKEAIAILKPVLEEIPDHPGAHHYTIHASDYPPLASQALSVARSYGQIAPTVPHALHMPTHIFTRRGLWSDSISMNKRSAAAAAKHPAGEKISLHYLHALDYLAYAYLQRSEDSKAKEVENTMNSLSTKLQPHVASAYTLAAVPARIALERQQWGEAAALEARKPESFPWDSFPAMEAIIYYARALGAARSGDGKTARVALAKMQMLQDQAAKSSAYWAKQVEIQRLSAAAWLEYEEGRKKEGLSLMHEAATLEDTTEKHPVTPGEVLPARELYADMLLADGQYKEAEVAYRVALKRSPNRFNSLYGAGRAAELGGDNQAAASYYKQLVKMVGSSADRAQVKNAKAFLKNN